MFWYLTSPSQVEQYPRVPTQRSIFRQNWCHQSARRKRLNVGGVRSHYEEIRQLQNGNDKEAQGADIPIVNGLTQTTSVALPVRVRRPGRGDRRPVKAVKFPRG